MSDEDLLRLLDELAAELKIRDRPEQRAWTRLAPTKNGWPTRLYDDQAFQLWDKAARGLPKDLRAVHHLAIMHHARAIDVEQSEHPSQSDVDWKSALQLWHQLYEADGFWADVAKLVDVPPELVPQVRQEMAEQLLRLHFDIALDEQSPHHRARFHVQLALNSSFPREVIERVRIKAYERAIDGVDAAAWAPRTREAQVLLPAIETVVHFLELDERCPAALMDLFRLLKQLQAGLVIRTNGTLGADEQDRAFGEIRALAKKYDGYIKKIESLLFDASDRDELVLSDLASWHSLTGQACGAQRLYDEEASWYDRALRAAQAGNDPTVDEYRGRWMFATALSARKHAIDDKSKARRLIGAIDKSRDLPDGGTRPVPSVVLSVRAQVWMLLGELDMAEHDARAALAALRSSDGDVSDFFSDDPGKLEASYQNLLAEIGERQIVRKVKPHMDKATQAIKDRRLVEATHELDKALAIDRDFAPALVDRAQCRLELLDLPGARTDLDRAERLLKSAGDERGLAVVGELKQALNTVRKQVEQYGGSEATRLRREGVKAFNEGNSEAGILLLRKARAAARPQSTRALDDDLGGCLNSAAVELVNPIARDIASGRIRPSADFPELGILGERIDDLLGRGPKSPLGIVRKAEGMLTEATALNISPSLRRRIQENLTQIELLRDHLKRNW